MRRRRPRLDPSLYIGLQRYFLTFCTAGRTTVFTSGNVVWAVHGRILQTGALFCVEIIAYCYMPDHVHFLVEGCREDANLLEFVRRAKQCAGFDFSQRCGQSLWQPSFYDRILRNEDATLSVARYIFENPVRAGLVRSPEEYPFLGSDRFTVKEVLEAICWQP